MCPQSSSACALTPLRISVLIAVLCAAGCAATGPHVSSREVDEAREGLALKAFQYRCRQTVRVTSVGHRLVEQLPPEDVHEQAPYIGLLLAPLDRPVRRFARVPSAVEGVAVVGAVPESPAGRAGLAWGDVIIQIDGRPVREPRAISKALADAAIDQTVTLRVWRANDVRTVTLQPQRSPFRVSFLMTDDQEINASAVPGRRIFVTYGLLRFVDSDDELAVVLGHELAHHTRHHLPKEVGASVLGSVLGITAAVGGEIFAPGSGIVLMRGVQGAFNSTFSQDFEREADDVGLHYAARAGYNPRAGAGVWERFAVEMPGSMTKRLFSTHPTSPERLLHMQKAADLLAPADGGAPSAPAAPAPASTP